MDPDDFTHYANLFGGADDSSIPDEPELEASPAELPDQLPEASIILPSDWWRCIRFQPVSGLYRGSESVARPTILSSELELRVDIDPAYRNSPVMNRVSGDFWRVSLRLRPGQPPRTLRVYVESWIIDRPSVIWRRCQVEISGRVRFWKGVHPSTTARIVIGWRDGIIGPATVTFTEVGRGARTYVCNKQSVFFREVELEIDVCQSVNAPPLLPTYDTHAHNTRPADLPRRTLTIEESYREAGLNMTINPMHTVVDDSAPGFNRWSPAELHDAMEVNFSRIAGGWPKWQMWGLLAGTFDESAVGGIMFDAAAAYGGAGRAPERQGFAVFRNHSWFNNLPAGAPTNQDQAWALRHFLYTYVHEAGHAFNFLHSWNKARPDALSWMNYDWRYDQRQGANSFWSNFRFRFDDEELIHLRHGDRAAVIMGGDPWASGGHLETPSLSVAQLEGDAPLELLLRSKGYFEFLEPVSIELRLRNLENTPLDVDVRLNPEYGGVILYIQRPNGMIVEYAPILCKLGTPDIRTLRATQTTVEGADRYSETIFLSYGSGGFYFDEPGEYQVRAIYQGVGEYFIPSNTLRLRIGNPLSREQDVLAQDYFGYEVGMGLYLGGSASQYLEKGMALLETIADQYKKTMFGAKAAEIIARSVGRSFYHYQPKDEKAMLVKTHTADPERALALTAPVLSLYRQTEQRALNIPYHELVRTRAEFLKETGDVAKAKRELQALRRDLKNRGVNESVLDEIKTFEESL